MKEKDNKSKRRAGIDLELLALGLTVALVAFSLALGLGHALGVLAFKIFG